MTAHTSDLDHALADVLHIASTVRFRLDRLAALERRYSVEAMSPNATVNVFASTPTEALATATEMLKTAVAGAA